MVWGVGMCVCVFCVCSVYGMYVCSVYMYGVCMFVCVGYVCVLCGMVCLCIWCVWYMWCVFMCVCVHTPSYKCRCKDEYTTSDTGPACHLVTH